MIEREYIQQNELPSNTDIDPWEANTSAFAQDDSWADDGGEMPDFSLFPEDQLAELLPKPLQDNFRLSQGYVQLIELSRTIPTELLISMLDTIRSGADEVSSFNDDFGRTILMLAEAIENCQEAESRQIERFHNLQALFETLNDKDRELFLATVNEVTEACEPLAS
ncbi:MAG: hypothetical protein QF473_00240 [Planctomycetota bacterium]|jgi:hypothetical protein|nr:hypothetical protein [Planctomycetota bacterium]MDP6503739.1 hypothetical protein [Planctomycetota bacterium]